MNLIAKFCDHFSVSLFLLPHMLFNFCWHAACVEFLTIDQREIFQRTKAKCFNNWRNRCGFTERRQCCWQKQQWNFGLWFQWQSVCQVGNSLLRLLVNFGFIRLVRKSDHFEAEVWSNFWSYHRVRCDSPISDLVNHLFIDLETDYQW